MDKSFNLIKNIDSLYERDLKLAMDVVPNNNIVNSMDDSSKWEMLNTVPYCIRDVVKIYQNI
ncbi:MAG: hypothetical protein KAX49_07950 [Halanaerobiales bacterium]|nr:hypothetical protein [Halanaerobiales bacterium]